MDSRGLKRAVIDIDEMFHFANALVGIPTHVYYTVRILSVTAVTEHRGISRRVVCDNYNMVMVKRDVTYLLLRYFLQPAAIR